MIAPFAAPNVFGPTDVSGKWQYVVMLAIKHGIPREEMIKDKLPADFPTAAQKLKWVAGRVEKYFSIAHEDVLKMGGPEC